MAHKCVFFDRDGIVNRSPGPGYVERWEDFVLEPAFVDVLRLVRSRSYEAVIVSNQRGVALGVMPQQEVERIHANLKRDLKRLHGLELLDLYYCPHDNDECTCRKPQPGMLLDAAAKHAIDLPASWMVGDSESDVVAGQAAGCRTVLVGTSDTPTVAEHRVADLGLLMVLFSDILQTD